MKDRSVVVRKSQVLAAAQRSGLNVSEAESLWLNLYNPSKDPDSKLSRIFYFLGAWIVCLALAWFMGNRYTLYGASALILISIAYAIGFMGVGLYLLKVKQEKTLGGLGVFLSVSLVPLITYATQDLIGWWPGQFPGQYCDFFCWIEGGWAIMELVTIGISWVVLKFIKLPLLTIPLYVTLWFMMMDIAAVIPPISTDLDYDSYLMYLRIILCLLLGLALIVNAFALDRAQKSAFAFWGHLFGVTIFWTGMTSFDYTAWIENAFYFLLNIFLIVLSPILERRVFLVFGVLGVVGNLFRLAHKYFADSANFPLVLSGVGLLVISIGWIIQHKWQIFFSKNKQKHAP